MKTDLHVPLTTSDADLIYGLLDDCPWGIAAPEFRKESLEMLDKIKPLLTRSRYEKLKRQISDG